MDKYTYEQQERVDFLTYLKEGIEEINNTENLHMDENDLLQFRSDLLGLVKEDSLTKVDLSGGKFDLFKKVNLYSEYFLYLIHEEILSMDPLYNHHLLKKKLADLTGYEYKRCLELLAR